MDVWLVNAWPYTLGNAGRPTLKAHNPADDPGAAVWFFCFFSLFLVLLRFRKIRRWSFFFFLKSAITAKSTRPFSIWNVFNQTGTSLFLHSFSFNHHQNQTRCWWGGYQGTINNLLTTHPTNLTCMFLVFGRKLENLEKATQTLGKQRWIKAGLKLL